MLSTKYKYVVAIDVGTTNTGAFYYCSVDDDDTTIQEFEVFPQGANAKFPTCFGLNNDDSFAAFGSTVTNVPDAEVFDRFKMGLYDAKGGDIANREIKSRSGRKTITLEKAFKSVLTHVKDAAISKIRLGSPHDGDDLDSMIKWVLTVPAIWSDAARRFMQDIAVSCGLSQNSFSDQVILALEPDCAALQAHHTHAGKQILIKGTRYMVVDCGGGTIDISSYEVQETDPLRMAEIFPSFGNSFGSTRIDENFVKLLTAICGSDSPCVKNHEDLAQNIEEFAKFKNGNTYEHGCALSISGIESATLKSKVAKFKSTSSEFASTVSYQADRRRLRITKEGIIMLIMPVVDEIVKLVNDKLRQPDTNIDTLVLAGGFSGNCILQEELLKRTPITKDKFFADPQSSIAIVKGALKYGVLTMRQNSSVIVARKMKHTYGVKVMREFDDDSMDADHKYFDPANDKYFNPFVFQPIISYGDTMAVGDTVTKTFKSFEKDQSLRIVEIYSTETPVDKKTWKSIDDGKVKTVKDEDVKLIHQMEIQNSQDDKFDIVFQNNGSFGMLVFVGKHYPKDQIEERDLIGPDFEMGTFQVVS